METILPNATEARRQVEAGMYEKANKQMQMITQAIIDAIRVGEMSISLNEVYPEPFVRQQLEAKGYKVKSDSHRNEQLLSISW